VQTFLPFEDFAESVASLDNPRLGKQRVETLQLLRASLMPSYGWQNHPVSVMWRGYRAGLTAYGLASVREWLARGHADSTATLMAEFAPDAAELSQDELAGRGLLPPWLGDENVHRSHRSNLIRKDAEYYTPKFPGTPGDLDYVWPGAPASPPEQPEIPSLPTWVVRAESPDQLDAWREAGIVAVGERSPRGKETPAWRAQVSEFVDFVVPGIEIGVLVGNSASVARATIVGEVESLVADSAAYLTRTAEFTGEWARTDFAIPAALQNPRSVFRAPLSIRPALTS